MQCRVSVCPVILLPLLRLVAEGAAGGNVDRLLRAALGSSSSGGGRMQSAPR